MNKKILALDLDETLLNSDKTISDENILALNKMLDQGHVLCIDSGRPIFTILPVTNRYQVFSRENVYLIGYQGGIGYDLYNKKLTYVNYVNKERAVELARLIDETDATFLGFDLNYIYVFEMTDDVYNYNKCEFATIKVLNDPLDLLNIDLCKLMAVDFDNPDKLLPFQTKAHEKFCQDFEDMFSRPEYLEFTPKGTSKGKGLQLLAQSLNIPVEDTISCGDERNDISMVRDAGLGVCVSNGTKELKEAADYITIKDNNHGAIAEVINKFIL